MAVLGVYLAKIMIFVGCVQCVLFSDGQSAGVPDVGGSVSDGGGGSEDVFDDDHLQNLHTATVSTAVKSCLAGADPFLPCINEQAMAAIEQTESMESVVLDSGLEISRRPGTESFAAPRGVYSLGKPPRCWIYNLPGHYSLPTIPVTRLPCLKWNMNLNLGTLVCGIKFSCKSSKIDFVEGL